jgi:hypothetical protein
LAAPLYELILFRGMILGVYIRKPFR